MPQKNEYKKREVFVDIIFLSGITVLTVFSTLGLIVAIMRMDFGMMWACAFGAIMCWSAIYSMIKAALAGHRNRATKNTQFTD